MSTRCKECGGEELICMACSDDALDTVRQQLAEAEAEIARLKEENVAHAHCEAALNHKIGEVAALLREWEEHSGDLAEEAGAKCEERKKNEATAILTESLTLHQCVEQIVAIIDSPRG